MKNNKKNGVSPLTLRERIEIEHKYRYGEAISNIAKSLGKNRSTIYREIDKRPRTGRGKYQADISHRQALKRIAKRGNISILVYHEELYKYVVDKLKLGWSPEQISIRLPIDFKKDLSMRISHEAIYTYIYSCIGSNGKAKKGYEDLRMYLPRRHKRRAKKGFRKASKLAKRENILSIEKRPEIVDTRSRIGDWEDDLVVSSKSNVCVKSVNDRKSGVMFFGKTIDKTAVSGDTVLIEKLNNIPSQYLRTLTRDNGSENVNFEYVQDELGLVVYYAHTYCSYERGSNENGNGLFRRFFPKGTDFSKITDEEIAKAEYLINTRPRKRFGGLTPAEVFYKETGVALFS
ncbi:MAG: IS30 family transposase [Patescibacteria group bacterium]|nr:IS30 family transposase [Patescibacteria group bacterium]